MTDAMEKDKDEMLAIFMLFLLSVYFFKMTGNYFKSGDAVLINKYTYCTFRIHLIDLSWQRP